MDRDQRIALLTARAGDYFGIMRTTIFGFIGVAAVIEFGGGGFSLPLLAIVITLTTYGALAGGTALDDIIAMREDMDDEMAETAYGSGVKARNIPMLKNISGGLVGLIGLAAIIAILF